MPQRATRARKTDGVKQYIVKLYESPTLKFLKCGEPWEPISDLIYGPGCDIEMYLNKFFDPDVRQRAAARLAELKQLWTELRGDILAAQKQYQPNRPPWGARFD